MKTFNGGNRQGSLAIYIKYGCAFNVDNIYFVKKVKDGKKEKHSIFFM